jgi:hypothetical protein
VDFGPLFGTANRFTCASRTDTDRIPGSPITDTSPADNFLRPVTAADHTATVGALTEWIEEHSGRDALAAVGHRVGSQQTRRWREMDSNFRFPREVGAGAPLSKRLWE